MMSYVVASPCYLSMFTVLAVSVCQNCMLKFAANNYAKNCSKEQRYACAPRQKDRENSREYPWNVCVSAFVSGGTGNLYCVHSLQGKYMPLD